MVGDAFICDKLLHGLEIRNPTSAVAKKLHAFQVKGA